MTCRSPDSVTTLYCVGPPWQIPTDLHVQAYQSTPIHLSFMSLTVQEKVGRKYMSNRSSQANHEIVHVCFQCTNTVRC